MKKSLLIILPALIFFSACRPSQPGSAAASSQSGAPAASDADGENTDDHGEHVLSPFYEISDEAYFIGTVMRPGRPLLSFDMDYRKFFTDNRIYNRDIALASSVIAAAHLRPSFLERLGFTNIITVPVGRMDNDRTEVLMGRRRVIYSGRTLEITKVYIRSNNGSFEEMFSDLDIGADTEEYFSLSQSTHPEWVNRLNVKGLDVTANRTVAAIKDYIAGTASGGELILWISGFGRGGGIANIVGAYFEKSPFVTPFTYTFASPNTTTSSEADTYLTVFNIINSDDMNTLIPPAAWGFTRFGRDMSISVAAYGQEAFRELTGVLYTYHSYPDRALNSLIGIVPDREALYVTNTNFFIVSEGFGGRAAAESYLRRQREGLRRELQRLVEFHIYESSDSSGYRAVVYQSPAFFIHSLPETMAFIRPGLSLRLADSFLWPQYFLITAFIESVAGPPHMPVTYYLMVRDLL